MVEAHIGVKVHERIPDSVLAEADEIVNVDLAPEDLLQRLREGKIYPQERIGVALENFFQTDQPGPVAGIDPAGTGLADRPEAARREPESEHDIAPDQVMVCLSSRGPNTAALLRYGSRLAGRLNTNWYAVYVQTPREEPTAIDAAIQRQLSDTLTLAKQLGAQVFPYKGEDVVETILHFAREYRVGHIVIGKPGPLPCLETLAGPQDPGGATDPPGPRGEHCGGGYRSEARKRSLSLEFRVLSFEISPHG